VLGRAKIRSNAENTERIQRGFSVNSVSFLCFLRYAFSFAFRTPKNSENTRLPPLLADRVFFYHAELFCL
jgi:hypothetical protein